MEAIKLIACDIDGVLLEDTFSPVLRILAEKYGVDYTAELENNTFSQRRDDAAAYLKSYLGFPEETTTKEIIDEYFKERKKFMQEDENPIISGVPEFLEMLKSLNVKLVCYGGLEEKMIDLRFRPYFKYFDQYICTNSFRPGLKEITKEIYGLDFSEVLFIDDVNRVAEEAKKYQIPFIGVPAQHTWGFQEKEMKNTGVKYLVKSVKEITKDYLEKIDLDKAIW
ncbi:HAD family hydrolase [Gottfriedia acidiceleris]|uniref:HAD family hydrolase n=1 Tax=Gottfriedia acidiceleris TaxID=371036 RepID=UPI002FFF469B